MPTQRLHKVLLDSTRNHFAALKGDDGQPLDLNKAAQAANPNAPPYTEVCVAVYEIFPQRSTVHGLHDHLVLRGHAQCECFGHCEATEDHQISPAEAFSRVPHIASAPGSQPTTPHGPGQGYMQGLLPHAQIRALHVAAVKAAGGTLRKPDGTTESWSRDPAACACLGATLGARAQQFELSASDIEGLLGHQGHELHGRLVAPGSAVAVLDGSAVVAGDYYWVSTVLAAYSHLVGDVYTKLSRAWTTHPIAEVTRLSGRPSVSTGVAQ